MFAWIRAAALGAALSLSLPAWATIDLTFDDGEGGGFFTTIDHPNGVTLTADPAGFASYGVGDWSGFEFLDGSALEIFPAGAVTFEFPSVMSYVQLALAHDGAADVDFDSVASVVGYTAGGVEVFPFPPDEPLFGTAERRYTFLGSVKRLVVGYSWEADSLTVLAVDNVTAVPEPGPTALLLAGLLMLAGVALRRR